MICKCQPADKDRIYFIINEAAKAYEGAVPADCYHQPYMSIGELIREMKRITFFGWEVDGELVGVTGVELVKNVTLIRHAYVLPRWQKQGIGGKLLNHLKNLATTSPLLVGTWADARWAIDFYRKHGFELLPDKDELLKTYWDIPQRQIETSVVLGINLLRRQIMASPRGRPLEMARFIEEKIKAFASTNPRNRLPMSDRFIFDEPLVQFADGDDPLFVEYKSLIDPTHLTPREALAKALNQSPEDLPAVSVISWILPITSKIRESNRRRKLTPSRPWAYTRLYGEKFNDALREYLAKLLTEMGYLAAAPALQPYYKAIETAKRKGTTQTGRSGTSPMPLDWAPSAFPMASSPSAVSPTAAGVWSPPWYCLPAPGQPKTLTPTASSI